MLDKNLIIEIAEEYRRVAGLEAETTVSYRVFGDTKKLTKMREGADITVGRFNTALRWFRDNWPEGAQVPLALREGSARSDTEGGSDDAAA